MFKIHIAQLNILIINKYNYIKDMCQKYLTDDEKTDFTVSVTVDEIMNEDNGAGYDPSYLESLAIYRRIAEKIIDFDGFLMHGVAINVHSKGVIFTAKSGVGKTTHTRLWQKLLGDEMTVINGDKPLIRIIDSKAYAYGTPWAGKEGMHTNSYVQVDTVCFLERFEKNECYLLNKSSVLDKLFSQIYLPGSTKEYLKTIDLLSQFINSVNFYKIKCNMDLSAAKKAYEEIFRWKE